MIACAAVICLAGQAAAQPQRYTLTIFVDAESLPNGHVFLGLSDGRRAVYRGWYSGSRSPAALVSAAGGVIKDDTPAVLDEWSIMKTYPISTGGYAKAFTVMEDWDKEGRPWGIFHHCGDFVNTVATSAGVKLNLPVNLKGFDRPGRFGQYLAEHGGIKRGDLSSLKVILKSAGATGDAHVMITSRDDAAAFLPGLLPQVKTITSLKAPVIFTNLPPEGKVLVSVTAEGRKPVERAVNLQRNANEVTIDLDAALLPGGGHIIVSPQLRPTTNKVGGSSILTLSYLLDKFASSEPVNATVDVWITGPESVEFPPRTFQVSADGQMTATFEEVFPFSGEETWHYAVSAPGYQTAVGTISCKVIESYEHLPQEGALHCVSGEVTPKQGRPGDAFTLSIVYRVDGVTNDQPTDVIEKVDIIGPGGSVSALPLKSKPVTSSRNHVAKFTARLEKPGEYVWKFRLACPGRIPGSGSANCVIGEAAGLVWKLVDKQVDPTKSDEKLTQQLTESNYHGETHDKGWYRHSVDLYWTKVPAILIPGETICVETTGKASELETADRSSIGFWREADWSAGGATKNSPSGWSSGSEDMFEPDEEISKKDRGALYGYAPPGDGYKPFARAGIRHFYIPKVTYKSADHEQYCFLNLTILNVGHIIWFYRLEANTGNDAPAGDNTENLPAAAPLAHNPGEIDGAGESPVERTNLMNGDFEAGLAAPWGTGLYSQGRAMWWNAGDCQSQATADGTVKYNGRMSLHIVNQNGLKANSYGTTAQRVSIRKNQLYRLTLWAKGSSPAP